MVIFILFVVFCVNKMGVVFICCVCMVVVSLWVCKGILFFVIFGVSKKVVGNLLGIILCSGEYDSR